MFEVGNSIRRLAVAQRKMTVQPSTHVYEVRPRKDKRGVDLISDALPFGRLWYGEPNAIGNAIGYAQFILLSWFGTPCVLDIPPSPRLRRAQAKEEEAETL
jgi:hypothetical protein